MLSKHTTILLTLVIGFQAFFVSAMDDVVVMCLGGGHQHDAAEAEHCESVCDHDNAWPLRSPDEGHDCGCVDIELTESEFIALPRLSDDSSDAPQEAPIASWGIVLQDSGLGRRGPPALPRWLNPGQTQLLAFIASIRLTI